ncbi:hypothetical protein J3Q64DRAFT_1826054 [Phycomyces blakesleeanus]|uniref:Uncharacterized protein n=2 Tax=Phycomyces blakesleeanus TaxID=4837 RepID=A0A167LY49_PHYB8|nr:hypothetical protein PHYBLDRAFT_66404 [Phycomyces blakesleeanus NRRL 1555(-)]OAD71334.1 hypothetical protein PHYBLDRAFT_66404 [Phycomyces blakesleeanus NRRL 1555(-)]|eukprot:XP_018289374.1 hypothetical protein PHYBLDRAFT_66404 [Phycomyces blakesleeanus NRRL 1555(-)]
MKFSIASTCAVVFSLFAITATALPTSYNSVQSSELIDAAANALVSRSIEHDLNTFAAAIVPNSLEKRTTYPIVTTKVFAAKVIAQIKAQLHTKLFVKLSTSITEKVNASLDIEAKILGGLLSIHDKRIVSLKASTSASVQAKIEATLTASLNASIYASIEAELKGKTCRGQLTLTEEQFLELLAKLEAEIIGKFKVELPKIEVKLSKEIDATVKAEIKNARFHIPILLDITRSYSVDVGVTVKNCIEATLKTCASLDAKVLASAIIKNF